MATSSARLDQYVDEREPIFVAIIAEDRRVSLRLRRALANADVPMTVALAATRPANLTGHSRGDAFDLIVLHAGGDEKARLAAANEVRTAFSGIPLVIVWDTARPGDERRALRLGVDGVVIADELETALVPTLQAVSAGLVCVPRALRHDFSRENLSAREKQILGMLVMGFTNAQIAAHLYLAESTVKSHLSSAYEKLGVRSRKDAAALILDPTLGLDRGILSISVA